MQREALFNKSERQVAESQLATVQQQLAELQAQSSHIQELHKDIQESQGLVKEKDRKVRVWKACKHNCCSCTYSVWWLTSCLLVWADHRAVKGGVSAKGGPGSSVASSRHHILLFLYPSWQPWATNGTAEQDRHPHPAAPGENIDTKDVHNVMIPKKIDVTLLFSVTFLQDWEKKHKQVVTIYRSHLLAAVQVS